MFRSLMLMLFAIFITTTTTKADIGPYYGLGAPYTSQMGLSYKSSAAYTLDLGYNSLSISFGDASVELTKPEINLKYHFWGGATYFGLGLGYMNLEVTASSGGQTVTAEVSTATLTPSLGWLWGVSNGGFYFGVDFGYQVPLGAEVDVSGPLTSGEEYEDTVDAAEKFGESSLAVITFAKIGYLF